jgi:hypothetical protein
MISIAFVASGQLGETTYITRGCIEIFSGAFRGSDGLKFREFGESLARQAACGQSGA